MTKRILLRGGIVADGIGATARRADLLIDGPVIASIRDAEQTGQDDQTGQPGQPGRIGRTEQVRLADAAGAASDEPGADEVIDLAPGSVVCPGFIDAHAHAEGALLDRGRVDGALAQGVTTLVVGQDGQSWIGATADTARYLNRYFAPVNGVLEPARSLSVADYHAAVSGRLVQNVAVLASQGTIRHNVAGLAGRPLDPAERAALRRYVEDALADGAVGLSSGLDYLPSRFGGSEEIAGMARPLAAAGRPYVSHLRGYGPAVGAGLAELSGVGARAGVRVHASHLWGAPPAIEAALAAAEAGGVAVTYDTYPYRRSSTILAVLLLPASLQARGPDHTLAALADPGQRASLLAGDRFTGAYLQNLYLGCLPDEFAELTGLSVTAAARRGSQPAGEWVLDLLSRTGLQAGAHLDRTSLADEHLAWLAHDDRHCAGSDGIYQGQHPHPRGYGAFSRLAGYYLDGASGAGDQKGAGYQKLARHLAANAADVYGLRNRGRLAAGMAADVCVIGPAGLTDRATDETPQEPSAGMDLVLVNGAVAWRNGRPMADRFPGQAVS